MKKQRFMDQSTFICPVCNNRIPLMRPHGKPRERGHIKDMWCPFCKDDRKFKEIRRTDYFVTMSGEVIYM